MKRKSAGSEKLAKRSRMRTLGSCVKMNFIGFVFDRFVFMTTCANKIEMDNDNNECVSKKFLSF